MTDMLAEGVSAQIIEGPVVEAGIDGPAEVEVTLEAGAEVRVELAVSPALEVTLEDGGAVDVDLGGEPTLYFLPEGALEGYYDRSETDALLDGKSDTGHDHDGRYYTRAETAQLLAGKSDTGHDHDGRYYTRSEADALLAGKSDADHDHDGRYYTESEVDALLEEKGSNVIASITFPAAWTDSGNGYYTATPTIDAVFTSDSKIDLQPDIATIAQLRSEGVEALYIENNSMALTAYAVGNAPSTALTMQCTVTESEAATTPTPTPINPTIDAFYPVGSIYLAATSLDPNIVFGGTWVRIKDTFLLASGDTYAGGTTGGEAEHTLNVNEMPFHGHVVRLHNNAGTTGPAYLWDGATPINNTWARNTAVQWVGTTFAAAQGGAGDQSGGADPVGGGAAHNNMPPYLAIWVWQRTA